MQFSAILVVAGLILSPFTATAHALTASELKTACLAKAGRAGDLHCDSYVRGLLDGIADGQAIERRKAAEFCPPKGGIETANGRRIIEAHFQRHAEQMSDDAGLPAMLAILSAFPCKAPR